MTTIMSDLLCMSSTYDFVAFENNCVSELFFLLVAEHTDICHFCLPFCTCPDFVATCHKFRSSHTALLWSRWDLIFALLDPPVLCSPSDATERLIWLFSLPVMHLRARVAQYNNRITGDTGFDASQRHRFFSPPPQRQAVIPMQLHTHWLLGAFPWKWSD